MSADEPTPAERPASAPAPKLSADGKPAQDDKPPPKEPTSLGLPMLVLGALWGAVTIVLSSYSVINGKRDEILRLIECQHVLARPDAPPKLIDSCQLCCDPGVRVLGPADLYLTNLLPLQVGLLVFLGIVSYGVWVIPNHVAISDPRRQRRVQRLARVTAALPLFAFLGFALGAAFDAVTLWRLLH
jgi:hypothetical protein